MSESNHPSGGFRNNLFLKDLGWYVAGTAIPMLAAFFRTPVFTRYFTPEEFGYLGIVTITFSYLSVAMFSWLASCLWRYYNHYKREGNTALLFSNIWFLFLVSAILMVVITMVWWGIAKEPVVQILVALSLVRFILSEVAGLVLIVIRLDGKAFTYNAVQSVRAVSGFALLAWMAFGLNWRIEAVLISYIIIDVLVTGYLLFTSGRKLVPKISLVSAAELKILLRFGIAGLVANLSLLILTSGDRYIIAIFGNMADVGIYNQVYSLSQLGIAALVSVFFNTINPTLIRNLEFDYNGSSVLIGRYVQLFLLFGLPITVAASLYPKEIALVLLGPGFREGYPVMPWVFFSAFVYGLTLFSEARLKFANKLKAIAFGVIAAGGANIALNFVFVPVWGYQAAAITTLISYLLLFVMFYFSDTLNFLRQKELFRFLSLPVAWLVLFIGASILRKAWFSHQMIYSILEAAFFLLIYVFILFRKLRGFDFKELVEAIPDR